MISMYSLSRYKALQGWLDGEDGRAGCDRLRALGAVWPRLGHTGEIVDGVARMDGAPPMPPLNFGRRWAAIRAAQCIRGHPELAACVWNGLA